MKPLKNAENSLLVLTADSDAIVLNRKTPLSAHLFRIDRHLGLRCASVLYGILNKILEKLLEVDFVDPKLRQALMDHLRLGLPDALGEIQERFAERFVRIDQFHRLFDCACGLCVGQQIPDKGLCAMGALDDKIQELTA